MAHRFTRLHSRYFCNRVPTHRVFPYDSLDSQTEAPAVVFPDRAILLRSLNGSKEARETGIKWAWCWACNDWVQGIRKTQGDLLLDYLERQGVSMRVEGRTRLQKLAAFAEKAQIREEVKVVHLRGSAAPRRSRRCVG